MSFSESCPDCGTLVGQPHKNECDVERCSVCGTQRLTCECEGHDPAKSVWTGEWPDQDVAPESKQRQKYLTKPRLIEAAARAWEWEFPRQLSPEVAGFPEGHYPVVAYVVRSDRRGKRNRSYVRCVISVSPFCEDFASFDISLRFFMALPTAEACNV